MYDWVAKVIGLSLVIIAFLLNRFAKTKLNKPNRKLKLYLGALLIFILGLIVFIEGFNWI